MRLRVCSLALLSGVAMSHGVGCRHGSDPELLRLCLRQAVVALIQPLAWEPPYAMGAALKKAKKHKMLEAEFLMWHSWISSGLGVLGLRFIPWPGTVG